ncbi:tetratricopeptide repeat protein (plasmid) [Skermanella mucosa]|uniref:tetratricopeptide repeat protein n=1 Tax=Skermanella mucosa TaxID=1789672 RepID=UPI00192A9D4E|nr:tetratricopeptide repeat protein [Skermanella mucosa]UEM24585.1 tetratricopeptide repeat protein [Skermanella mucosa]
MIAIHGQTLRRLTVAGFCAALPVTSVAGSAWAGTKPIDDAAMARVGPGSTGSPPEHPGHRTGDPAIGVTLARRLPTLVSAVMASPREPASQGIGAGQDEVIDELQRTLGLGRAQVIAFCRIIGEVGIAPWRMGETLADITRRHRRLTMRVGGLPEQVAGTEEARADLAEALDTGDLARAYRLVEEIGRALQQSSPPSPGGAETVISEAMIQELRGEIAWARLRYRQAADHFREAAARLPADQAALRLRYLEQAAEALFGQGADFGDNDALAQSVRQYGLVAQERSRADDPLAWGTARNNLGKALWILGSREESTTLLEQAVEAYRAALQTRTQARAPLHWAATQHNLGLGLSRLGLQTNDMSLARQAAAVHRAVLGEQSREETPLEWARSQAALGTALLRVGTRERSVQLLDEAAAAYRAALDVRDRDRNPWEWAATRYNLGHVLLQLGWMTKDRQRLEEAVEAYRDALGEQVRERDPIAWAHAQTGLGAALMTLDAMDRGTAGRLEEAVRTYRAALSVTDRHRNPLDWARIQTNLGIALRGLGLRQQQSSFLEEAVDATRGAHEVYMDAGMVHLEAYFTDRIIDWEAELAAVGK